MSIVLAELSTRGVIQNQYWAYTKVLEAVVVRNPGLKRKIGFASYTSTGAMYLAILKAAMISVTRDHAYATEQAPIRRENPAPQYARAWQSIGLCRRYTNC